MRPGERKILNKLVLGKFVTVQGSYKKRIRAGIHNLVCGKVPEHDRGAYIVSLRGNINYVRLFDPTKADKMEQDLDRAINATTASGDNLC
jgi:hypothetical protein